MLAVVHVDKGIVEVNYMWLPSWIGMNSALMKELGQHMKSKAEGRELNASTLLDLHYEVLKFLDERFQGAFEGLSAYLQGLQNVRFKDVEAGPTTSGQE
jgi:hypothetical protein